MNTPKIRFKGFTDDWEQRKLGELGKATGGTSIESEFSAEGVYKVISIGSYSENSVYNDQGIRAIKSDKTNNRVLNRNDLTMILNDKTTSGNIIGRVLLIEESGIYVYNQRNERIEINVEEYDPVFLYEMLNAPNIREKIIKQSQGNTQIYVNWSDISLLDYMIPSKEEQVKIGEYLHNISHLITLHQRKCDETKELKKFMLQKMFPKNGEKNPEIRFEGFTDDWEQRKFSDLYVKVSEKNDLSFGADKIISVANMYFKQDIKESGDDYMKTYNVMRLGDIAFEGNKSKNYAHGRFVENTIGDGIVSHVFDVFRPIVDYDLSYWKYFINNEGIMGRIMARCTKSSTMMTNLVANDFLKEFVLVPALAEQKEIGEYFRNLDNLITLHQRKCEKLKELKKFMLQNMFV